MSQDRVVSMALHADQGVRVNATGRGGLHQHIDTASGRGGVDTAYLITPVVDGEALHAWWSAASLEITTQTRVVAALPLRDLPTDWAEVARKHGEVTVLNGEVEALSAEVFDKLPHLAAHPAKARLKPLAGAQYSQVYSMMCTHFNALQARPHPPLPVPARVPEKLSWSSLSEVGWVGSQVSAVRCSVYVDQSGVSHEERSCPQFQGTDGFTPTQDLEAHEAVATACLRCGPHPHREFSTYPTYDPIRRATQTEVTCLTKLRDTAQEVLANHPQRGPWWAANQAYAACVEVVSEFKFTAERSEAAAAATTASSLLCSVDAVLSTARLSAAQCALVDRCIALAGQDQARAHILTHLDAVAPGLGGAFLSLVDQACDPWLCGPELVALTGGDPDAVAGAVKAVLVWLDQQAQAVTRGPLTWVAASGQFAPAMLLPRLCAWKYGSVTVEKTSMFAAPAKVAAAVAGVSSGQAAVVELVAAGEDLNTAAAVLRASSYFTQSSLRTSLQDVRETQGIPVPGKAMRWRSFTAAPVSVHDSTAQPPGLFSQGWPQ